MDSDSKQPITDEFGTIIMDDEDAYLETIATLKNEVATLKRELYESRVKLAVFNNMLEGK